MNAQIVLTVLSGLALAQYATAIGYVETGECEQREQCSYTYSAKQQYVNSGDQQVTQVNATVDITCASSGVFNGTSAKLYCMGIRRPNIFATSMENSSDREIRAMQQNVAEQLGNWFCFVQSGSGKISAVYHSPSEPDHVISMKKSIAAAFQANFEGTEEEEEIDPQSKHTAHYTYLPTAEEGVVRMQRKIRKADVSEYSNEEEPSDDIDTTQDEEVEYRSGRLERSSGNASFHLVNATTDSVTEDVDETISLSRAFAASGSYKMELQSCRRLNAYSFGVLKRRILSQVMHASKEEDLKATMDRKKTAFAEMERLREQLPSGSVVAALQSYDTYGDKLAQILLALLELESQYGPLDKSTPLVIDEVMTFISEMPKSGSGGQVREVVMMLLSAEGSLRSQMALLSAYDNAANTEEANTVLVHISFVKTARVGFVIGMEERLARPPQETFLANQLLLVFGSLATKGSDEVEDRVMKVLSKRVKALNDRVERNIAEMKVMLHALGNTGSKLSTSLILSIIDTSTDSYDQLKPVAIEALAKVTNDPVVLARLEDFLEEEDSSTECAAGIIDTLKIGHDYFKESHGKHALALYSSQLKSHTLLYSLAEAVSQSNDTDLHSMLREYLKLIQADAAIFDLIASGNRGKRATNDWDSNGNSDYNYVDSLVNRQAHVNTYSKHRAYLNSHTIGISDANVKIAYGYFAGTNTHCDQLKTFGRFIVVGKVLSNTRTLGDVKFDLEATTTSISLVTYVRIGTSTLLDVNEQRSLSSPCYLYTNSIREFRRRIFRWSYSIFVYVGYLTLHVDLTAHFNLDVNANFCIGRTGTEVTGALAALTPTAGITLGGGVTGNLLELARGGVSVSASFNYRLEPAVSAQGCTAYCQLSGRVCIGIYASQPDSYLDLDTWYQTRIVDLCGSGWFRYPCIRWGSRNRVDSLSARWSLGSASRRAVWQRCSGNLHPTCAAGALSSPLFSY